MDDNDPQNPDLVEALRKTKANNDKPCVQTFFDAIEEVAWVPLRYFETHLRFRRIATAKCLEFWDHELLTEDCRVALDSLRHRLLECLCSANRRPSEHDTEMRKKLIALKHDDKKWIDSWMASDGDL